MDPATSAGGQCGGVYWFYSEFVDLSHNSLSVIGVVLKFTPHPNPLPQGERGVDREKFRQVLIRNWRLKAEQGQFIERFNEDLQIFVQGNLRYLRKEFNKVRIIKNLVSIFNKNTENFFDLRIFN